MSARKLPSCGAGSIRKYRDNDCTRTSGSFPSVEGAGQEACADHLQTVTSSFVRTEHQASRFKSPLDDRNLAFVDSEVNQFYPSIPFPPPS